MLLNSKKSVSFWASLRDIGEFLEFLINSVEFFISNLPKIIFYVLFFGCIVWPIIKVVVLGL